MSKRRRPGDVVIKRPNAGFIGEPMVITIFDHGCAPCILGCGDDDCNEWYTSYGPEGEVICHVSECEMMNIQTLKR